jgi:hypothetical protein
MKLKQLAVVGLIASTLALSGCGAMSTAVKKRNLDVKTQMSETIWLEPSSEKTVYFRSVIPLTRTCLVCRHKLQMNWPPKATASQVLLTPPTTGFRQTC